MTPTPQPKALELAHRLATRQVRNYCSATGDPPRVSGFRPDRECAEAADLIRTQHAELEALRKEVEHWRSALTAVMLPDFKDWHENNPSEWPEVAALVIQALRSDREAGWAEVERLQEDAARYRVVRSGVPYVIKCGSVRFHCGAHIPQEGVSAEKYPAAFDAAIDAAREAKSPQNNTTPGL